MSIATISPLRAGNRVVGSPPVLLGDTILTAVAASVSFVVPTGYDILFLYWHDVYGDNAAATAMRMRLNSDTGNNYDYSEVNFGSASSTTNAGAYILLGYIGDTDGDQLHQNGIVTIFNRISSGP